MITPKAGLSVSRQCTLLGIARSSFYYRTQPASSEELDLLARLDRIFTDHPVYGSRRPQVALAREGVSVGRRRLRRSPPDRASAVPCGQAGKTPSRFPRLAHRLAAAHKLHSTAATTRIDSDSGKGETISWIPALAYSPRKLSRPPGPPH
jgi:hypothetical protein